MRSNALRCFAARVVDNPKSAQVPPIVGRVGAVHVECEVIQPTGQRKRRVVADHCAVRPAEHSGSVGVGDERTGANPHVETSDRTSLLPKAVEGDAVGGDGARFFDPQLAVTRLVIGGGGATHRGGEFHRELQRVHDRRAGGRVELVGDDHPRLRVVAACECLADVEPPRLRRCGGRVGAGHVPHVPVDPVGSQDAFVQAGGDCCRAEGENEVVVVGDTGVGRVALQNDVNVAICLRCLRQVGVERRYGVVGRDRVGDDIGRCVQRDHHRLDVRGAGVVVLVGDVQRHRHVRKVRVVRGAVDLHLEVARHRRAGPVCREVRRVVDGEPQRHILARRREGVGVRHRRVRRRTEPQAEVLVGDRVAGRRVEVVDRDVGDDAAKYFRVLRQVDRQLRQVCRVVIRVGVQRRKRILDCFESCSHQVPL